MKLIALTGKAHSGKDEIGKHLWAHHAYVRIALADPLKWAAANVFELTGNEPKEEVIPYWGLSPRQIWQRTGDAFKSEFGPMVWVKRWLRAYLMLKDTDNIVCTDLRSDGEAEVFKRLGAVIIRVERKAAGEVSPHHSENGITIEPDYIIHNDGTKMELYREVDKIIEDIQ